jgi:hypothetical protein
MSVFEMCLFDGSLILAAVALAVYLSDALKAKD